jgi:hypothetical protein
MTSAELASRAVADPNWRWMPGMRYWLTTWDRADMMRVTERADQIEALGRPGSAARPDLDDPATLGCIEHGLLPACGYGSDAHLDCWTDADGVERWTVVYRPDPVSSRCLSVDETGHASKAEALVVALEAGPR